MGVGYSARVVQWSKNDYPLANNPSQDDMAIISNRFLARAPQRVGGGADAASAVALVPPTTASPRTTATGMMANSGEAHLFKLRTSGPGTITLRLAVTPPASWGSRAHLAAKVRLLGADGATQVAGTPTLSNVGQGGIDTGVAHLFAGDFLDSAPNATGNGDTNYVYVSTLLSF